MISLRGSNELSRAITIKIAIAPNYKVVYSIREEFAPKWGEVFLFRIPFSKMDLADWKSAVFAVPLITGTGTLVPVLHVKTPSRYTIVVLPRIYFYQLLTFDFSSFYFVALLKHFNFFLSLFFFLLASAAVQIHAKARCRIYIYIYIFTSMRWCCLFLLIYT